MNSIKSDLGQALPFYEKLLPELGFTRTFHSTDWYVFAEAGELPSANINQRPSDVSDQSDLLCRAILQILAVINMRWYTG